VQFRQSFLAHRCFNRTVLAREASLENWLKLLVVGSKVVTGTLTSHLPHMKRVRLSQFGVSTECVECRIRAHNEV
jgi:hypothetical protein